MRGLTSKCDFCGKPMRKNRHRCQLCRSKQRQEASIFPEEDIRNDYRRGKRLLWGGSGKSYGEIGEWAHRFGRRFERVAIKVILPIEGFTEIDDVSRFHGRNFPVDVVATKDGKRVLVDVTTKWHASVPKKAGFADILRLPLFILHVSPRDPKVYFIHELPAGKRSSHVPMRVFHDIRQDLGREIKNWPKKPRAIK
jgi:hypothetical protein